MTSYTGNYDEYERNKQMQDDVILAAFKNQQEKIKRMQKFIAQNRVKARTASRVQSRVKMLDKIERVEPPQRAKTVKFNFPQPPPSGRRALEVIDLVKHYGDLKVYDGFSFSVDRGDRVGLVGPNGAGKSTLMKLIGGIIPYDGGSIKYGHQVTTGYFAQHQSESLNSERSVLEEAQSTAPGMTEQEIRNLLGAFLFSGDDVFKKVRVLSGGEKSRLALSKILLSPPNLLLMDEPTNHLDIPSCEILEEGLKKYSGTLILITHDRRLMNSVCTGILEIEKGRTDYYSGNYEYYQYKKALMEQAGEQEPEPLLRKDQEKNLEEAKTSRKDRKRREAENRAVLSKARAPIQKELKRLEALLGEKERRKRDIEAVLADPGSYDNRELILPLLEEAPSVEKEIKEIEAKWEDLQSRLEDIDKSA